MAEPLSAAALDAVADAADAAAVVDAADAADADADAADAAERDWQFGRLVARLSVVEPEDVPLPAVATRGVS